MTDSATFMFKNKKQKATSVSVKAVSSVFAADVEIIHIFRVLVFT